MSGGTTANLTQAVRESRSRNCGADDRLSRFIFPIGLLDAPEALCDFAGRGDSQVSFSCDFIGGLAEGSRWWLVYTKSRQEKRLSEQLSEMQTPHYLPVHHREAVTRGRIRLVEEPLFSGYLFMFCNDEQRRDALTTNRISVTHAVSLLDAIRLPHELAQIAKSIAGGARLTLESNYAPGDWVRVRSGPHQGLEGTILRRQNKTRIVLSVNFLKQGASLEVPDCYLERATPPDFSDASCVEIVRQRGK